MDALANGGLMGVDQDEIDDSRNVSLMRMLGESYQFQCNLDTRITRQEDNSFRPAGTRASFRRRQHGCSRSLTDNDNDISLRKNVRNYFRDRISCFVNLFVFDASVCQPIRRIRRRHRSVNIIPFRFIVPTLFTSLYFSIAAAEGDDSEMNDVYNEDGGNVVNVVDDDRFRNSSTDEWYMVLVSSLLFGFFITLFGAVVGYFSVLEDLLMRRYMVEGELIRADVVSAEFARGGGHAVAEYNVFVEYLQRISVDYTVRVRKQVKAKESDFIRPPRPGLNTMLMGMNVPAGEADTHAVGAADGCCMSDSDRGPIVGLEQNHSGLLPTRVKLEIYVLPGYARSGYPRKQVERACSWRYRFATMALIAFDLSLAAFCTRLAAGAILDMEDGAQRKIGWYAIAVFITLIVLEVPLIHFTMKEWFVGALQEEYLDSGEYIPVGFDDSSLSSGSDFYLSMERHASALSTLS